jgi:hypothetical protein
MGSGVRDCQFVLVNQQRVIGDQVKIQSPRRPPARPLTPVLFLDPLQRVQQRPRRQGGLDVGHGVEKVRLVRTAHRRGPSQRRNRDDFNTGFFPQIIQRGTQRA